MTVDHLFPILENERDSMLLVEMVQSGNKERTIGNHRWHPVGTNDGFAEARWWREGDRRG